MTKEEFLKRIKREKLEFIGEYMVVTDNITDEPLVLGCAYDEGKWKVYQTWERGRICFLKEFDNENEAFDYFYEMLLSKHRRYMKRKQNNN